MTLPASGVISMGQVNTELGRSATAQLSLNDTEVRLLFAKPSGAISLSDGYGKPQYASQYPPAYNDTYVKATSRWTDDEGVGEYYYPWLAFNPAISLTGIYPNKSWISANGSTTNQRIHFNFGSAKIPRRIYYENSHYAGTYTNRGIYQFILQGSNDADAFANLNYEVDTNWTQLTVSQNTFDEHVAADVADPKYINVSGVTGYQYCALKVANARVSEFYMAVRRIELQTWV